MPYSRAAEARAAGAGPTEGAGLKFLRSVRDVESCVIPVGLDAVGGADLIAGDDGLKALDLWGEAPDGVGEGGVGTDGEGLSVVWIGEEDEGFVFVVVVVVLVGGRDDDGVVGAVEWKAGIGVEKGRCLIGVGIDRYYAAGDCLVT